MTTTVPTEILEHAKITDKLRSLDDRLGELRRHL
jgi:hypothetical protein